MDIGLVSVVMPVYNSSSYINESIKSILDQTYKNFEFIIIDNGSTDDSVDKIKEFMIYDDRIKLYHQTSPGISNALNLGIKQSKGIFIFRMDSDDISSLTRFERTIEYMISANLDVCGSFIKKFGNSKIVVKYPISHYAICSAIDFCSPFAHPSVCFNARIKHLISYDNVVGEDLILWKNLKKCNTITFGNIPQILLSYRTHSKQSTNHLKYKNINQGRINEIDENISKISELKINFNDKYFIVRNFLGSIKISIGHKLLIVLRISLNHFIYDR